MDLTFSTSTAAKRQKNKEISPVAITRIDRLGRDFTIGVVASSMMWIEL